MSFPNNFSSFNFYRKPSSNEENHSVNQSEKLFSENSNNVNADLKGVSNSSSVKEQQQEYHCITCNRTYDGVMRCRHVFRDQENNLNYQQHNVFDSSIGHNITTKIYICPYDKCEKKFNLESGLIRHKVVHTGQKPYSCDFQNCQQSFNQKSNLNRHKKIHKNEKPFICQKCCKSFTTTTNLKQHSQTHIQKKEQRKQYICGMKGCNKKYLYRCNLKKHKLEHEDPVQGCLDDGQRQKGKSVKKAKFQITLTQANVTLQIRQQSVEDHSQMKITYQQNLAPHAQIYNPVFMLPSEEKQQKSQELSNDDKMQEEKVEETLIRNLEEFFISKASEISASFYIHPDLMEYSQVVISQVITLLQEKGTKQIRFFVENKDNFSKCVQDLMRIYFASGRGT